MYFLPTLTVLEILFVYLDAAEFSAARDVMFLLRIRNKAFDDEEIFRSKTMEEIKGSSFDPAKPTTFLIHGYTEDRKAKHHLLLSKSVMLRKFFKLFSYENFSQSNSRGGRQKFILR